MNYTNYMGIYGTSGDVQTALDGGELKKPYVALVDDEIDWNSKSINYNEMPLTFEIVSGGTLYTRTQIDNAPVIQYRLNKGEWVEHRTTTKYSDIIITVVSAGDIVEFRGNNNYYSSGLYNYGLMIYGANSGVRYKICGNIMSLINSTNFSQLTTLTNSYNFKNIFSSSNIPAFDVINIENLILPATALTTGCYYQMFQSQINISGKAPVLPATTLKEYCYADMFNANSYSYQTNLNYIKCLATDISANSCTANWVKGIVSSGTFVKNPNMSNWGTGNSGIPDGWTVIDAS